MTYFRIAEDYGLRLEPQECYKKANRHRSIYTVTAKDFYKAVDDDLSYRDVASN